MHSLHKLKINLVDHLVESSLLNVKPSNILMSATGPRLIDFGISKIVSGRTFSLVGTPHYMSPEIIEGKGYTKTADYWSLGIIIYEMVCGSLPFGDEESAINYLKQYSSFTIPITVGGGSEEGSYQSYGY